MPDHHQWGDDTLDDTDEQTPAPPLSELSGTVRTLAIMLRREPCRSIGSLHADCLLKDERDLAYQLDVVASILDEMSEYRPTCTPRDHAYRMRQRAWS